MVVRIQVTGDRNWNNRDRIYDVLYEVVRTLVYQEELKPIQLVVTHGAASGADEISGWVARDLGASLPVVEDPHPANWYRKNPKNGSTFFFRGAGPERNGEMLELDPQPLIVLAFHNNLAASTGTKDCVLGAIHRQFPVRLVSEWSSYLILPPRDHRPSFKDCRSILAEALVRLHPLTS